MKGLQKLRTYTKLDFGGATQARTAGDAAPGRDRVPRVVVVPAGFRIAAAPKGFAFPEYNYNSDSK